MLIIEDNAEVGMGLQSLFAIKGYDVERANDGDQGLRMMSKLPPYDIVLLDVMMPKKDGFQVLNEARKAGIDSPVIILTVKANEEDKLLAFGLGADDYVTKPFNMEELLARVKAVLNRTQIVTEQTEEVLEVGGLTVDFKQRIARLDGEDIPFTSLEYDILHYFVQYRGRTVSRKQLLRDVWGISGEITTRTIDRHVASLRKKIEKDPNQPEFIETVYGIGYKFIR